jgi:AcrR family transcriptional regulator
MVALRERQKTERHRRIVGAAAQLFGEVGYEQASMEAIADLADVSKATLYNYYQNKGDLLLAIVTTETRDTYEIGRAIIEDDMKRPEQAVLDLINVYVGEPMKLLNKETYRRAISMSIQQPDSLFGQQYADADRQLGTQLVELILTLSKRGHLADFHDPAALGEVLFNNVNMMFTLFMIDDAMSLDELRQRLARQTCAVLKISPGDLSS